MPSKLMAGRFEKDITSTASLLELLTNAESVGVRWSLENFGTQRIEVLVKARSIYDAYDRYNNHLGQRLALFSHWAHRPISGFITEVDFAGANRIRYVAKGPIVRLETEVDTNVYADTLAIGGSSGAIATVLSNMSDRIDDTTTDNIAANSGTLGGMQPQVPEGEYQSSLIRKILSLSDASFNIYDFWLVDEPFSGGGLQLWTPYYKARSSTNSVEWQVSLKDIRELTLSRNVDNIVTDATVFYSRATGVHDGSSPSATFSDASANFLDAGVTTGDSLTNITDGSRGQVEAVTATTITVAGGLSGGTNDDFRTDDVVNIDLKSTYKSQNATTTANTDIWDRAVSLYQRHMGSGQATQYANMLLSANPEQIQAFTITSRMVRNGDGSLWPLWEVIAQGGGYIRVNDLFPTAAMLSDSLNALTTFYITALDYDNTGNNLRVNVDNNDTRLDARLRREKILNSEMVHRGPG